MTRAGGYRGTPAQPVRTIRAVPMICCILTAWSDSAVVGATAAARSASLMSDTMHAMCHHARALGTDSPALSSK